MKKDAAKPKQEAAPGKKPEAAQKNEEPKGATPAIVVDEGEKKSKGNPTSPSAGKRGNVGDGSSSPEDAVVNGDNQKGKEKGRSASKGKQKPYTKAPTTILEEGQYHTGLAPYVDGSGLAAH